MKYFEFRPPDSNYKSKTLVIIKFFILFSIVSYIIVLIPFKVSNYDFTYLGFVIIGAIFSYGYFYFAYYLQIRRDVEINDLIHNAPIFGGHFKGGKDYDGYYFQILPLLIPGKYLILIVVNFIAVVKEFYIKYK